jgi:hypothetical protein
MAANVSGPAVFRTIEITRPTFLIDEGDTFLDADDLRGILNAGHKRGGRVIRCVGEDFEPRAFDVFAPVAFAVIRKLASTLKDRSISVPMKRATSTEQPKPIDDDAIAEAAKLARQCARWAADYGGAFRNAKPAMPGSLFNRTADNWRPLFALAEVVGDGWCARLEKAVSVLESEDVDAEGLEVRLLADVRVVFDRWRAEAKPDPQKASSEGLCKALARDEDGPWGDYKRGKPLTQKQLAALLKPFGIKPHTIRLGTETAKGYERKDFDEAWERYLPATTSAEKPVGQDEGWSTTL